MHKVLVLLAQGCEEIEAVTIIDILRRAGIEVTSAGLDDQPVRASRGVMLMPDTTLDAALQQSFDMVVLPGGQPGTDNLKDDARIIALLQQMAQQGKYVCRDLRRTLCARHRGTAGRASATSYPTVHWTPSPALCNCRRRGRRQADHLARPRHGNGFRADAGGASGRQGQAAGSRSSTGTLTCSH